MSGELVPDQRDLLMSDADRERAVARLQSAVAEGRLTLDEFQERVDGVLRARRFGEIEPYLADLPAVRGAASPAPEFAELRSVAAALRRSGRWMVPRVLRVSSKAGAVKLDFTDAVINHPVVHVQLDVYAGGTTLVLPSGATVDVDGVEMYAGRVVVSRKIPQAPDPMGGPHFVVTGRQKAGGLTVRHRRHFLRWSW